MIWSFVALYLIVIMLTHLPWVQQFIGQQTAQILSKTIGSEVEIGNVNLGFLNRVIIDDVTLLDQQGHEMVNIGRLSTRIDFLPLTQGKISISSIQIFGAKVKLTRQDEHSPLNIQFMIDAFASNDSTSNTPLDLRINSVIVRRASFSYDQLDAEKNTTFDTKHLHFEDISTHVILKILTDDSLNVNVKRLTLKEQSGLQVKKLAFKLIAGKKDAQLSNFALLLPHSELSIDSINAHYEKGNIKNTLNYQTNGMALSVDTHDLICFLPSLSNANERLQLATDARGTASELEVANINATTASNSLRLKGSARISNLNGDRPAWHVAISSLNLLPVFSQSLSRMIEGFPEQIANIGTTNLSGYADKDEEGFLVVQSTIKTDAGDLKVNLQHHSDDHSFAATIQGDDINLNEILQQAELGKVTLDLNLTGNNRHVDIKGSIPHLDYKNYPYQNIAINGRYLSSDILKGFNQRMEASGMLSVNDPNIQAKIDGECMKNGKNMDFRLHGDVSYLTPKTLHLSDNWGDAVFEGRVQSDFKASNLNDAEGTVVFSDFAMKDSADSYRIERLQLQSGYTEGRHYLEMDGDMGHAELTGQFDWETLPQSFINFVASQLPTLPGLPKTNKNVTNNFDIRMDINNTEWLSRLLNIPLNIQQPLTLNASINDTTHELFVDGSIPSFSYNDNRYEHANIHITTPIDSIVCRVDLQKVMDDNSRMDLRLNAFAYDNQLATSLKWNNHASEFLQELSGEMNSLTQLYTDDEGKAEAYLHIQPSHIVIGGAKWNVVPCDIFYTDKNLNIQQFSIEHGEQHLSINGTASTSPSDTLMVDLKDIDVEYVLNLVNFHAVKFDGFATGNAYITQPFDSLSASADLSVKEFRFENGRMGTLRAHALWNNEQQQIDINALADDGAEALTHINGYVSPVREDILLNIKGEGTYIDFLQNYSKSFLKGVTGHAYGDVRLVGPLGDMDLLGTLVVDGKATVIPLGTTYTLNRDTVRLVYNDILLNRAEVHDKYNNTAYLSGGIHHDHLSRLTFDLDVETSRLLAYDFADYGNEVFCGTVVSAGKVDMHGRLGEVVINCNVTPLRPTVFRYNAASADAVNKQEFITWHEITAGSTVTTTKAPALPVEENIPTDIYLNFLIDATPQASLRLLMDEKTDDYITLNGSGMLRASYHNKGAFNMYGTYTVDRGTYGITIQNIIKKNFLFKEGGTIVFGGNPMNANLNLQAIHTVNGVSLSDLNIGSSFANNTIRVNCLMNILGQAGAPRVEFDLDMPTVNSEERQMIRSIITSEQEMNQQVLYLLGIGRFYTQGINNADAETQEYGQTELAMQSLLSGTLSSQINGLISEVIKNDNWNFGANISTGNEGWHNAEYEGLVSGRLFNNRLLINGQFGYRDNARQATPSFIGDFDIRYLLQPNGNLALKVYNQTNNRYFTRSSLNTQGIGIILKRDFNNLGDLFAPKKKKP